MKQALYVSLIIVILVAVLGAAYFSVTQQQQLDCRAAAVREANLVWQEDYPYCRVSVILDGKVIFMDVGAWLKIQEDEN